VNLALISSLISTGGIMLKRRDQRGVSGYGGSRCYCGQMIVDGRRLIPQWGCRWHARPGVDFHRRAGTETAKMTFLNLLGGVPEFCLTPKMML